MYIAFMYLVLVCLYTRVPACTHSHKYMHMWERVCDSPSLKYHSCFPCNDENIPKDKILMVKTGTGIGEQRVCAQEIARIEILVVAMLLK